MTTLGSGKYTYTLEEDWARLPEGMTMGNASAVATDSQNRVYVFQRKDPPVLIFGPGGNYLGSWGLRAIDEAHGIYIEDDIVYLTDRTDSVCVIYTLDGKPLQVTAARCPLRYRLRNSRRSLPTFRRAFQLPDGTGAGAQRRPVRVRRLPECAGASLLPRRPVEAVLGRAGQRRPRSVPPAPQHRGPSQRQPVPVRPGEQPDAGLFAGRRVSDHCGRIYAPAYWTYRWTARGALVISEGGVNGTSPGSASSWTPTANVLARWIRNPPTARLGLTPTATSTLHWGTGTSGTSTPCGNKRGVL